jgi:hypothetical protein
VRTLESPHNSNAASLWCSASNFDCGAGGGGLWLKPVLDALRVPVSSPVRNTAFPRRACRSAM